VLTTKPNIDQVDIATKVVIQNVIVDKTKYIGYSENEDKNVKYKVKP